MNEWSGKRKKYAMREKEECERKERKREIEKDIFIKEREVERLFD